MFCQMDCFTPNILVDILVSRVLIKLLPPGISKEATIDIYSSDSKE
uniref:Uncharacterized protein n=1 Tax=Arundo donax TaxID=35708 RepID=A0A0A9EMG6_ARUDO